MSRGSHDRAQAADAISTNAIGADVIGDDMNHDDGPAAVLGEVWTLLDELPHATPSERMTATTIEMAAVTAAPPAPPRSGWRAWIAPAAAVATALVAGIVLGRATAPANRRLLEDLPVIRHLDLLREAGSPAFLEALADRLRDLSARPDMPTPGVRGMRPGGDVARRGDEAFAAEFEALRGMLAEPPATAAAARAWIDDLPLDERLEFERSAAAHAKLSSTERQLLADVAAALVDPDRPELRDAATSWHRWISVVRPEDRPEIIGYGAEKRLEWIAWYASRFDLRGRPGGPVSDRLPREWSPPGGRVSSGSASGSSVFGGSVSGGSATGDRSGGPPGMWSRDRRPSGGFRPGSEPQPPGGFGPPPGGFRPGMSPPPPRETPAPRD
jgi:hypothetical protein